MNQLLVLIKVVLPVMYNGSVNLLNEFISKYELQKNSLKQKLTAVKLYSALENMGKATLQLVVK